ncbi:MAG: ABC transporter permease [Pseudomonadota bacterium]
MRRRAQRLGPRAIAGGAILALVVLAGLVSLAWTPHDISGLNIAARLQPPSAAHLLGTDHLGRDVLSMLMIGARAALFVALVAVALGLGVGVPLGLAAAGAGGALDEGLMRATDIAFAFPAVLTAIMITAAFGPGALNATLAIGLFNIPVFARLTRNAAGALWTRDFVLAARAMGLSRWQISRRHVLPNVSGLLTVQATTQLSLGVLAEAGLSYLGLGVQPPTPSWGRMLNEGQTMMAFAPHLAVFPGLAVAFTVLGLNLLGDALRDRFDARMAGLA